MARINVQVTMQGIYSYEAPSYAGYGMDTHYIYNMVDEDGVVYVWKTTTFMGMYVEAEDGHFYMRGRNYNFEPINKGDVIGIRATVKGESEYKGQPQTEINRVKVLYRIFKAKTWEEVQEEKRAAREQKAKEQAESLHGEDFIWRMPYRQYKEHYSDCETVEGSFERRMDRPSTIEVIVRAGRLKASGVRGKHYCGYALINENNEQLVYRAVCEENAIKRAMKEYPSKEWKVLREYR